MSKFSNHLLIDSSYPPVIFVDTLIVTLGRLQFSPRHQNHHLPPPTSVSSTIYIYDTKTFYLISILPISTSACTTTEAATMVQYWRAAGMTYLTYSVKCADLVRQALKEPVRSQVLNRVSYSMIKGNWESGKIVQRSKSILFCYVFVLFFVVLCDRSSSDFIIPNSDNVLTLYTLPPRNGLKPLSSLLLATPWLQSNNHFKPPAFLPRLSTID